MAGKIVTRSSGWARRSQPSWTNILTLFACLACHALASTPDGPEPVETLIIDTRSPYKTDNGWVMLSPRDAEDWKQWKKRQNDKDDDEDEKSSSTAKPSVTTTFAIVAGKPTQSSTTSSETAPSALPTHLDSLASGFKEGSNGDPNACPKFINWFLNTPEFKECYPLSMLLDHSKSFFDAQRSPVTITRTLDATCAANATRCSQYFAQLAQNFTSTENCGNDYTWGTPAIVNTYKAMVAYAPIYSVGCLRDEKTSAYCFANAVGNTTSRGNTYLYTLLPFNKSLPGSSVTTCDECTRQTMNIYQASTADRRQQISLTYEGAAKQINLVCGPGFVQETLAPEAVRSWAGRKGRVVEWTGFGVVMGVLVWLI
ncbi:uncharacterized protein PODANS_7_5470 [Podospora anserina S mat+]|uniref:Podospora anserina S mat+ genomic DNA chromosome 7, supercontig 1 n=1 Tax=Podospora anserina (strain S / ATCC MYA-4624 / DSM 980 / FGSC 10383) TaxID=515849 RepID=B2AW02_PODAN|nr:uncharacterized protein PODANS_7_5470 [Podospora anserina S mat+]CAP68576.1 unnamed protein product [Podospora anserina S mat+]CDP32050.1 Putative protein of unknown function [Podospora anserina S mat+]